MADDSLFRKAALDKLASPERLDVLMQVTSPKGWIALWTIAALLVGVVVWSVFGSLPERINGQGILTGEGGLRQIRASGDGRLAQLNLAVNQVVAPEEVVGQVASVNIEESVRIAQVEYESALRAHEAASAADQATIGNLQIQRSRVQGSLSKAEANLDQRKSNLAAGIGTTNQVRAAEADVDGYVREIGSYDQQIRNVREQGRQREIGLERLRAQVQSAETRGASGSEVRSTVAGKVVSVAKQVGDMVRTGEVVAEVESTSEKSTLEIIAFVSSSVGQRIRPGHPAQITVAGVPREEFGFLRGQVRSVSQYAETPESIAAVLRDSTISEASFRVVIDPEPNAQTPTGYAWSTGVGPRTPISGGTPITVAVEVDQRAPISLVLPVIKGSIGG